MQTILAAIETVLEFLQYLKVKSDLVGLSGSVCQNSSDVQDWIFVSQTNVD